MPAPDGHDQEERHQGELVADVEQDDVARQEGQHDGRFHEQELRVEAALALRDGGEAHQHAQRDQERREQDEEHADGVGSQAELDAEGGEQLPAFLVGPEVGLAPGGELEGHHDRGRQHHESGDEAHRLGRAVRAAEAEDGADERQDDEEDGERHDAPPESQIQTTQATMSPMPPAMVSA